MKQATGKINPSENRNKVSIQLKLGGHSFSADSLPEGTEQAETVEFAVLTAKTLLVPAEEFDPALADSYLQLAGMACTPTEIPVFSDPAVPIVAVMAADAACVASLKDKLGTRIRFTTPLLYSFAVTTPTVWLCHTGTLLYMKVYDPVLRFAETLCAATEADVIYYVERLSEEFLFTSYTAVIAGERSKETAKQLRNYFPRVVCE